jgi:hypothetical protein
MLAGRMNVMLKNLFDVYLVEVWLELADAFEGAKDPGRAGIIDLYIEVMHSEKKDGLIILRPARYFGTIPEQRLYLVFFGEYTEFVKDHGSGTCLYKYNTGSDQAKNFYPEKV